MLLENHRQLLQIVGSLVHPFLFCLLSIIGICIRGCDMTVVSLRYDHQGVCKSTPWYFSYRIEGQKAKTRGSLYFIDDGIFKRTVVFFDTFHPIFSDESRFAIMTHRLYLNSLP